MEHYFLDLACWPTDPPLLCVLFFDASQDKTVPSRTFDPRFRFPINIMRLLYTLNSTRLRCHDDRCVYQRCYNKKGRERDKEINSSFLHHSHLLYPFTWILVVHAKLITFLSPSFYCSGSVHVFLWFLFVLLFRSFYVTLILVRLLGFLMLHSIYHLFYIVPLLARPSPSAFPYIRSAFIITHTSSLLTRLFLR